MLSEVSLRVENRQKPRLQVIDVHSDGEGQPKREILKDFIAVSLAPSFVSFLFWSSISYRTKGERKTLSSCKDALMHFHDHLAETLSYSRVEREQKGFSSGHEEDDEWPADGAWGKKFLLCVLIVWRNSCFCWREFFFRLSYRCFSLSRWVDEGKNRAISH